MKQKLLAVWAAVWHLLTRGFTIWFILVSSCIVFGFMCGRAWYSHGSPEQYMKDCGIPLLGMVIAFVLGYFRDLADMEKAEDIKERREKYGEDRETV